MKARISATVDKETERLIEKILKDEALHFRNKSHVIEDAIKSLEKKLR